MEQQERPPLGKTPARRRRAAATAGPAPLSRIQRRKREAIGEAALDVFSDSGFHGATLDRIAERAGLSKPSLLYYFASKEEVYSWLLEGLLDSWLTPLRQISSKGEPVDEIVGYVLAKLHMAQTMPRQSRLFADEILHGAPHMLATLKGPLKELVDEKARLIDGWIAAGRLAPVDPRHLIFSIWSTTQHYADFDIQVRAVLGSDRGNHFTDAARYLEAMFRRSLRPEPGVQEANPQ